MVEPTQPLCQKNWPQPYTSDNKIRHSAIILSQMLTKNYPKICLAPPRLRFRFNRYGKAYYPKGQDAKPLQFPAPRNREGSRPLTDASLGGASLRVVSHHRENLGALAYFSCFSNLHYFGFFHCLFDCSRARPRRRLSIDMGRQFSR